MKLEWAPGRCTTVETIGNGPGVVLAHGAGAGPRHPFMVGLAGRLGAAGLRVSAFEYPYVAEGRKAPDRLETLIACHRAVAAAAADGGAVPFLVGKSMGGRVGSHLDLESPGRVFLGYPLVAPGSGSRRGHEHLSGKGPLLFVQGSRDRLGPPALIAEVVESLAFAEMVVIEGADHSFATPKAMGIRPEEMLDRLAATVVDWIRRQPGGGT